MMHKSIKLSKIKKVLWHDVNKITKYKQVYDKYTKISKEGRMGDALALRGEEGRDKLR